MSNREKRVHYVSVSENAPLKWRRSSRPGRQTSFITDVLMATGLVTVLALGISWTVAQLMVEVLSLHWPMYRQAHGAIWPAAIFVASVIGLATAHWRLQVWDRELLPKVQEEREHQAVEVVSTARPDYRLTRGTMQGREVEIPLHREGVILEHDGHRYSLSGRQLDKIQRWIEAGKRSIRRSSNHLGPGFDQLGISSGEDYGQLRAILQGLGYVDSDNRWTSAGRQWASQAGLPEEV